MLKLNLKLNFMKLSSLLNYCKSSDCRYNPENVLQFLNDFMDDECSLCHRFYCEGMLIFAMASFLNMNFNPVSREKISVVVKNYRYYDSLDDVFKSCSVELKLVIQ